MPEPIANEPVAVFLTIMAVILVTPLLLEQLRLPGIVGLIFGGIAVGPNGLNLLATGQTIELLSTVGLIYLMFSAGLEIDLKQFNRVRNRALVFGLLTFSLPQLFGTGLGRLLSLDWPASILLGSIFASHTLVAFPLLSQLGITRNEAVSVTIGATVFTDVASLMVLAIVAGSHGGHGTNGGVLQLILLMGGYALLILLGLPRLGKWFFSRFNVRAVEFQFVLVVLFIAALLAEQIGMHAIVGAFLAGLAINSTLPSRSVVAGQVLFIGESFFIPIFLMYIGMIIVPSAFISSSRTLLVGVTLTIAVYVTKLLAAWLVGQLFHYRKREWLTMWGLSQAQAAATLATILVGVEIGLLSENIFNGAILMILSTTVTSMLLVKRYGQGLQPAEDDDEELPLFERILVPVANPETQAYLIRLSAILARTVEGALLPLHVETRVERQNSESAEAREQVHVEEIDEPETNIVPIKRIDTSISNGILHAALEHDATLIVMGWRGRPTLRESLFGTVLDEVVWDALVPVMVGRMTTPINAMRRVILVIPPDSLGPGLMGKTLEIGLALADAVNVPLHLLAADHYAERLEATLERLDTDQPYKVVNGNVNVNSAKTFVRNDDLVILTTSGPQHRFRSSLGRFTEQFAASTTCSLVVVRYPS